VKIKTDKQKRASSKKVTQRSGAIMRLFTKVCDLLALIGEFAGKIKLMDHIINKIAKMTISPFFVENIQQIQLSAIRCATIIFSKYPQHRQNLVIDILNSLARLPTSKRNLRNYRLSHLMDDEDDEIPCIQMLSALVLQLVQSVAKIPSPIESDHRQSMLEDESKNEDIDELPILSSLELATQISSMFLTIFLEKISSRKEEIDFRPLFENFIQDLLSTVNKPEWPAAETILSILGRLLVRNFMNKKVEISLRTASLEYLGVVAARLRKDALTSQLDVAEVRPLVEIVDHGVTSIEGELEKDLLTRQLQTIVIQHLNSGRKIDSAMEFSLNYSIATWVRDIGDMKHEEDAESLDRIGYRREHVHKLIQYPPTKGLELSYDDICIISRYLSANRSFNQSFDRYLRQILSVLNEQAVQVRTKSLKCLTEIVTVDPNILSQEAIAKSIRSRMEDTATSVLG
jgi:cohesin loading factor subunit SCC2